MSRWILALMFSFGTVTILTGCPAEEEPAKPATPETPETPAVPETPATPEVPATN